MKKLTSKVIGPFVALILIALTSLSAAFGVYWGITTLPWWVGLIVGAILFGSWVVDRLLYWGMATMAKRKASKSEFTQSLNTMMERIRQNQPPPYIPNTEFTPPKGGSGAPPKGGLN